MPTELPTKPSHGFQRGVSGNPGGKYRDPLLNAHILTQPFDKQVRALKEQAARIAYLQGTEIVSELRVPRKKRNHANTNKTIWGWGVAIDKVLKDESGDQVSVRIPSRLMETMQIAIAIRPVDTSKQTVVVDTHSQSLINTAPAAEIMNRAVVHSGTSDNG